MNRKIQPLRKLKAMSHNPLSWMGKGYIVLLVILAVFLVLYLSLPCWLGLNSWFKYSASILGAFAAIFAVVVALAIADRKKDKVKIKIEEPFINDKREYKEEELDDDIKGCYENFPVTSYRVHFKMQNKSGFDLKNPILTFDQLPKEKQPPYPQTGKKTYSERHFTFSIVRTDKKAYSLEVDKKLLISLDGLPYWNKDSEIDLWIRMVLDNNKSEPFDVNIFVNCENADGFTHPPITIDPKKLLKSMEKPNLT